MDNAMPPSHSRNPDTVEWGRRQQESTRLFPARSCRRQKGMSLLVFTLCVCNAVLQVQRINAQYDQRQYRQHQEPPPARSSLECQPSNPKYDWESMDYYELMGLKAVDVGVGSENSSRRRRSQGNQQREREKQDDMSHIDSKQVRKAYRSQAQLWHPDKISKKNNDDHTNKTSATGRHISIEESNARFAKIAEAYEVLSDPDKRQDYDLFLEYCRNQQQVGSSSESGNLAKGGGSASLQNRFSKLVDNLRDPFRVFEDFFYGGNSDDAADDDSFNNRFDPDDPFSYFDYNAHHDYQQQQQQQQRRQQQKQQQRPYPQEEPVRVFQHRENLYDPVTGEAVVRICQTEEYAPEDTPSSSPSLHSLYKLYGGGSGSFYFRIIAQDFKQRYDPYTSGISLVPITDLYVQEEGYRTTSAAPGPKQQSSTSTKKVSIMDSILHPWEVLTPDSRLLVSPNQKYVAGLSPECELLIMLNDPDADDEVVWSSQTSIGFGGVGTNKNNCFVILKGSHLIVAMGHPQGVGNRILWYSDALVDDERDEYYDYEDEYGFWHRRQHSYLAQLDNDGSLAVYSVWSLPSDKGPGNVAFKAWMSAKDWINGRIRAPDHDYGHLYYQHFRQMDQRHGDRTRSASATSTSPVVYKRCVYSTSRMGCFRLGRRLAQLSLEVYFRIKRIITKMNDVADSWLDLIYEEDDVFYSMKESLWKNGHAFGSKLARSSARFVRMALEYFIEKQVS